MRSSDDARSPSAWRESKHRSYWTRAALGVVAALLTAPVVVGVAPSAVVGAAGGTTSAGKAQFLWTTKAGSVIRGDNGGSGPLAVAGPYNTIIGLTPGTGSVLWRDAVDAVVAPSTPTGTHVTDSSSVVSGGTVFVVCRVANIQPSLTAVVAISRSTGAILWTTSSPTWLTSLVATGDVVIVTGDPISTSSQLGRPRGVYALAALSGSVLWHDEPSTTAALQSVPVVTDGIVLVPPAATQSNLAAGYQAFEAATGAFLWSTNGGCRDSTYPTFVATQQRLYLSCFPTGGDSPEVRSTVRSGIRPEPEPTGGLGQTLVTCIDLSNGDILWSSGESGTLLSVAGRTLYMGGKGVTQVAAVDATNGSVLWRLQGRYMGTIGSLVFVSQKVRPAAPLNENAGMVVSGQGVIGTFSFSGGSVVADGGYAASQGNVLFETTLAVSTVTFAVRLPMSGWTPPVSAMAATPDGKGYWLAGQDGGVFAFGDAPFEGSLPGMGVQVDDIVGMAATSDGLGYWLVGQDGGVFAFGDAGFYGSVASLVLVAPLVGMAATPDGHGYWLVAADGGVFAFGDAKFYGTATATKKAWPQIASLTPTPDGNGYWLATAEVGSMTAVGDASTFPGGRPTGILDAPDTVTAPGGGYWSVGTDGNVYAMDGAPFFSSVPALHIQILDAVDITPTPDGRGYWVLGTDGGVYAFGDAGFYGSRG
jgi:hypothetical protein